MSVFTIISTVFCRGPKTHLVLNWDWWSRNGQRFIFLYIELQYNPELFLLTTSNLPLLLQLPTEPHYSYSVHYPYLVTLPTLIQNEYSFILWWLSLLRVFCICQVFCTSRDICWLSYKRGAITSYMWTSAHYSVLKCYLEQYNFKLERHKKIPSKYKAS